MLLQRAGYLCRSGIPNSAGYLCRSGIPNSSKTCGPTAVSLKCLDLLSPTGVVILPEPFAVETWNLRANREAPRPGKWAR